MSHSMHNSPGFEIAPELYTEIAEQGGLMEGKSMVGYGHENRAIYRDAQVRDSSSGVNHRCCY